jgi:hypothetical protein
MKMPALVLLLLLSACATGAMNAEINRTQNAKLDKVSLATINMAQEEGEVIEDPEFFFNLLAQEIEYNEAQIALIGFGRKYLGTAYVFGQKDPDEGFDCSGFTQYAFQKALSKKLPRTAKEMSAIGKRIDAKELVAGDLVFFNTRGFKYSHVGIYIGEGRFFHASSKLNAIVIGDMNKEYFAKRYNGARRVLG